MIRPSPHLVVSHVTPPPGEDQQTTLAEQLIKKKQTNKPSICVGQIAATDQCCSSPSNDSIEAKAKILLIKRGPKY